MGLFGTRRPKIERLERRGDVAGLVEAARYRDVVSNSDGESVDIGAPVRRQALEALRGVDDPRAQLALREALEDDDEVALVAVAGLRDREVPEVLTETLARSPETLSPAARESAREAVLSQGDPALAVTFAAEVIRHGAGERPDADDQQFMEALLATDGGGHRQLLARTSSAELSASDPARRDRAIGVLTCLGDAGAEALRESLDQPCRGAAAQGLGRIGDAESLEALVGLLDDEDPDVRVIAAQSLGQIGDPRAVEGLLKSSTDAVHAVRSASTAALDRLGVAGVVFAIAAFVQPLLPGATTIHAAHDHTELEDGAEAEQRLLSEAEGDATTVEHPVVVDPSEPAVVAVPPRPRQENALDRLREAARRARGPT